MAILTHQKRIPWLWAIVISFPWASSNLLERISTEPLTFTLRRFIDDPGLIAFLASINILFDFMVGVGILTSFFQSWLWAVWGPVVYDHIPSIRMGTCVAGITFTAGVAGFLLINLGGLWVKGWTGLLGPSGRDGFDYSSILVLNLLLGLVAVTFTAIFQSAVHRSWVRPEGRLEIAELPNGEDLSG